jgi:hypothetical protein
MRFQSAVTPTTAEKVFRVARNSYTKTLTASVFARGTPVILTAASASNNGYDIVMPDTANQPTNNLYIGNVHEFPDTTTGQTGSWQPEDYGWVQCYGYDDDAVVANATDTIAANLILVPDTGSRLLTIAALNFASATAGTDANTVTRSGILGLVVLYQTLATSSAAGTVAAKVHIRAM